LFRGSLVGLSVNEALRTLDAVRDLTMDATVPKFTVVSPQENTP